MSELVRLQSF
uniref:Uncharacterized protein n=1 Tax=Anguilla anguilla TaxID=7936 RepID=A0A0E9QB43_ANGAN